MERLRLSYYIIIIIIIILPYISLLKATWMGFRKKINMPVIY